MAQLAAINWDNLSDEADITTSGGQGDPWEGGFTNGSTTIKADDSVTIDYGSFTARTNTMRCSVDASASSAARLWDASIGSTATVSFRYPLYLDEAPSGAIGVIQQFRDSGNLVNGQVRVNTTGAIGVYRRNVERVGSWNGTSGDWSTALDTATVYWLSGYCTGNASIGAWVLNIYEADGTLFDYVSVSSIDTRNPHDNAQFGPVAGVANWDFRFGEIWAFDDVSIPALPTFATPYVGWGVPV